MSQPDQVQVNNLKRILAVNKKINGSLDLNTLLNIIMETAAEVMETETASLLLLDKESQELIFRVALGDKGSQLTEKFRVKVGEGIAGSVAASGESTIVNNVQTDPRFAKRFDDDTGFVTKAILCVPIKHKEEIIGVLQAINPLNNEPFSKDDCELFESFADQAAIAITNAMLHAEIVQQEKAKRELQIASEIQMNFLPNIEHNNFSIQVEATTHPARQVGGDFYDILKFSDGSTGILVADVSGKGVPAALFMVNAISHFRFLAPNTLSPSALLADLNNILAKDSTRGMFMTCSYLIISPSHSEIRYANAGHHPILRTNTKETNELKNPEGIPVGLMPDSQYDTLTESICAGDSFCLYTDGITEARNAKGDEFTTEGLTKLLTKTVSDANVIVKTIFEELTSFSKNAEQHDDMTVVAITIPKES